MLQALQGGLNLCEYNQSGFIEGGSIPEDWTLTLATGKAWRRERHQSFIKVLISALLHRLSWR